MNAATQTVRHDPIRTPVNANNCRLSGLYGITDENLISEESFAQTIELALQGGCRIIQYRDKSADRQKRLRQAGVLRQLCRQYRALCIINDDIELACAVKADGVHLGRDDATVKEARQLLAAESIIGVSCYDDIGLALAAQKNSADYVAFGAVFPSPTKPHAATAQLALITQARQQLSLPICSIGGISQENIGQVITHGADMAAVISGLFSASDIRLRAQQLSRCFQSQQP